MTNIYKIVNLVNNKVYIGKTVKKKISESSKGKVKSEEHRQKLYESFRRTIQKRN